MSPACHCSLEAKSTQTALASKHHLFVVDLFSSESLVTAILDSTSGRNSPVCAVGSLYGL